MTPIDLADDDLLRHTTRLVGSERELTVKLVAYLAEIEERRLHLQAGFSSMFDFQLAAEQVYGRERVERCRDFRRKNSGSERVEPACGSAISPVVRDRVERALVGMGFRNAEARSALDEVEKRYPATTEPPPIERALREALLLVPCC